MGLLNQINDQEVVLPAIQRDFVWTEVQTAKLLNSIMRGYRVGIVLLWETYNDIQYRRFVGDFRAGTLHTYDDNEERRRIRLVLDDQQRLQSLYMALRGQREGRELYLDILSGQESDDVADDRFRFEFMTREAAAERNKRSVRAVVPSKEREETPDWWISVRDLSSAWLRGRSGTMRKRLRSGFS